jgi:hypothetical protein
MTGPFRSGGTGPVPAGTALAGTGFGKVRAGVKRPRGDAPPPPRLSGDVLGELGQAGPGTAVCLDYRALHLPAEPVSGQLPHEPVSLPGQPPRGQFDDMELLLHSGCHEPGMDG